MLILYLFIYLFKYIIFLNFDYLTKRYLRVLQLNKNCPT